MEIICKILGSLLFSFLDYSEFLAKCIKPVSPLPATAPFGVISDHDKTLTAYFRNTLKEVRIRRNISASATTPTPSPAKIKVVEEFLFFSCCFRLELLSQNTCLIYHLRFMKLKRIKMWR
jgi:hypothetical protein